MRVQFPSSGLFTQHRKNLCDVLGRGGLAVIQSNDVYPANGDASLPFAQCSDLFYLTGVVQEETILVLFPGAKDVMDREILFIRETSEVLAVWEGAKLSKAEAMEKTGVGRVEWVAGFDRVLERLVFEAEVIYLLSNEHPRAVQGVATRNARFIVECQGRFPLHDFRRLAPLLYGLRAVKSEEEVAFIKAACGITEAGFRRVLGFVEPGVGEWEIEAEFIHEFTRRGSHGFAYQPIVASGKNACVLHYVKNDCRAEAGDLLLLDVAAEYGGWNSDMTRTIPVSGKFSVRQREVYEAVLRVLRFAEGILRPGVLLVDYQRAVVAEMEVELVGLGLFSAEEAAAQGEGKALVRRYFMHGASHHLGLDVHDVSVPHAEVAVGMVFTIEPGIYIAEEGLGIRLENNYFIGEGETVNLMAGIPIEVGEIEELMGRR